MDKRITFTGAGCNAAGLFTAIANGVNSPSKETLPAAATWPFVTLSFGKQSAEFRMAHIKKNAVRADTTVVLSKLGYLYFQTPDHSNDFGFLTLRMGTLIKVLREHGYRLDNSCERNLTFAKVFIALMLIMILSVVVLVTVMAILKPNGI